MTFPPPICSNGRKQRFRNEVDARRVAEQRMAAQPALILRTYRCPYCNGYHLTRQEQYARGQHDLHT